MNSFKIDYAGGQIVGARKNQEDAYSLHQSRNGDHLVCLLADGMGGHEAGEVASELAIRTFADGFEINGVPTSALFTPLIDRTNRAISREIKINPELEGMGCTFVALEVRSSNYHWISVGDSPLFHIRNGNLLRMNADHSMASRLDAAAALGEITEEEAKKSPDRNALLSALTGENISRLDVSKEPNDLRTDDWLILASDGLETLDNKKIVQVVEDHAINGAQDVVDGLIQAVINADAPRQDNTTVIAIRLNLDSSIDGDDVITRPIRR